MPEYSLLLSGQLFKLEPLLPTPLPPVVICWLCHSNLNNGVGAGAVERSDLISGLETEVKVTVTPNQRVGNRAAVPSRTL